MKTCAICGHVSGAKTCPMCGEASWLPGSAKKPAKVEAIEIDEDLAPESKPTEKPKKKARK